MNNRLFLSPPHLSGREQEFVGKAIASNWIAPLGPDVDAFEKEVASFTTEDAEDTEGKKNRVGEKRKRRRKSEPQSRKGRREEKGRKTGWERRGREEGRSHAETCAELCRSTRRRGEEKTGSERKPNPNREEGVKSTGRKDGSPLPCLEWHEAEKTGFRQYSDSRLLPYSYSRIM